MRGRKSDLQIFFIIFIFITIFSSSSSQECKQQSTLSEFQQKLSTLLNTGCNPVEINLIPTEEEAVTPRSLSFFGNGKGLILSADSQLFTNIQLDLNRFHPLSFNGIHLDSLKYYSDQRTDFRINNGIFKKQLNIRTASGSLLQVYGTNFMNVETSHSVALEGFSSSSSPSGWNGINFTSCTFGAAANSSRTNPSWDLYSKFIQTSTFIIDKCTFNSNQMNGALKLRGKYDWIQVTNSNFLGGGYTNQLLEGEDGAVNCGDDPRKCYQRWGFYNTSLTLTDSLPLFKSEFVDTYTLEHLAFEDCQVLGCESTCILMSSLSQKDIVNLTIARTSFSGNVQLALAPNRKIINLRFEDNSFANRVDLLNLNRNGTQFPPTTCSAKGSFACPLNNLFSKYCNITTCDTRRAAANFVFSASGNDPTPTDLADKSVELSSGVHKGLINKSWMNWSRIGSKKRAGRQTWLLEITAPTIADYYGRDPLNLPKNYPISTMGGTLSSLRTADWGSLGLSVERVDELTSTSSGVSNYYSGSLGNVRDDSKSNSLSGGAIAGIIIALLVVLVVVAVVVFILMKKRNLRFWKRENNTEMETRKMEPPVIQPMPISSEEAPSKPKKPAHLAPLTFLKDIKLESKIGTGNFGDVFRGIWNNTTKVAAKRIRTDDSDTFMEEAALLVRLNHPNIVRMIGVWRSENNEMYMILDYCQLGSLSTFLAGLEENLPPQQLIVMCQEVAAGMAYLETQNIVHRDLGARNLLVKEVEGRYAIHISDFGLSRKTEDYYTSESTTLPYRWCAPEMMAGKTSSTKSDVWSFGITCWEIFSAGRIPYTGMSNKEVVDTTLEQGCTLTKPKECPENVWKIILSCFAVNPKQRPTFQDLFLDLAATVKSKPAPSPPMTPFPQQYNTKQHYDAGEYVFNAGGNQK